MEEPSVDPDLPFVLSLDASGGPQVVALNEAASALGLAVGDRLADARARAGILQVRPADRASDDAALRRLGLWATRYTPVVSPFGEDDGADGLFLDVTGSAHLFGGEKGLLTDLDRRLAGFGLTARLALAGTPGAAWALVRHGSGRRPAVVPERGEARALRGLPVAALRLSPDIRAGLQRLGFRLVGDLMNTSRAPLVRRFGTALLRRLDQALGRVPEPLAPLHPPPAYSAARRLLEPIIGQDAVVLVATDLMEDLAPRLERDGVGAQALRLGLYRVDGAVLALEVGLALPSRSASHVGRLVRLQLERRQGGLDPGFGFEAARLDATAVKPLGPRQTTLATSAEVHGGADRLAGLADGLRQRLGDGSVRQLWPVESHVPERAAVARAVVVHASEPNGPAWSREDDDEDAPARPVFLLSRAEPAEDVLALVPDGPPQRFRWRGALHRVAAAEGPERIAAEWWRGPQPTRDYFLVEDEAGRRLWLFREGLYGRETEHPRWFVHGLFA